MTISYLWLSKYIKTEASFEEILTTLTSIGLEVEGTSLHESIKGGLKGLVIGEVLTKEKHPNADKLSCTTVNLGNSLGIQKIVCGAANVAVGQKVIVAPVGTSVFPIHGESFDIKAAKIRGEESNGMICAEDEIGLGTSHDGILVLPNDAPIGTIAATYFNIQSDILLEINLTPNRTDAMSHVGIARDVVAGLKAKGISATLVKPALLDLNQPNPCTINISIESSNCLRYTAISISNIKLIPTPSYIKDSLEAIGVKSINHIVDITNYVLHEYGQPLHAFDSLKIKDSKILVRNVSETENMTALDGNSLRLVKNDIVITDGSKVLCLAGIYGSKESGVSEQTQSILLESACFDKTQIRKTAQRLNLRTDAAQKFEKGTDINITIEALQRAAFLIKESYPEVVFSSVTDYYPNPVSSYEVSLRLDRLNLIGGRKIPTDKIKSILLDLGISIGTSDENIWKLHVPTYKIEVLREEDIIEEILRIDGYNNIPFPSKLNANLSFTKGLSNHKLIQQIGDYLIGQGINEIMCNTITSSKNIHPINGVKLVNSMTSALDSMRSTMIYGGIEAILFNCNRDIKELSFFEFGSVYTVIDEKYKQNQKLAIWLTGKTSQKNWLTNNRSTDYYDIKAIVENLLQKFIEKPFSISDMNNEEFAYGIQFMVNQQAIAQLGKINNDVTKKMDVKQEIYYASIDIDQILKLKNKEKMLYSEVSKYPSVRRDLAMIIDDEISFEKINDIAFKNAKNTLQEVNLFDVYKGENIENGKKSYAISFKLAHKEKTLTDKEIEKTMSDLIKSYENELKAIIRTS